MRLVGSRIPTPRRTGENTLIPTIALAAALLLAARDPEPSGPDRPHVLVFVTDDQRDDFLGCAGHPFLKTKVIDRLAARGVRFANAFVTTPICAASRATILTGAWERAHGYTFGTPPLARRWTDRSYPALLRRAGYHVGYVGKFGVAVEAGARDAMFDVFRELPLAYRLEEGGRHLTDRIGDAAVSFLERAPADRPYCLTVGFHAPHAVDGERDDPYPCAPPEDGLYEDAAVPPPRVKAAFRDELPDFLARGEHRVRWEWRFGTEAAYERNVRAYFRMIAGIDRVIGRVLEAVERRGFADRTVVLFLSDNGIYLGSRGLAGKWSHFEESLRIPFVLMDPRLAADRQGARIPNLVVNADVPATILALAGVEAPPSCQGRSVLDLAYGDPPEDWRTDFLIEHRFDHPRIPKWEGVRGERYVYARYFEHRDDGEFLHDLAVDPLQLRNLARDPESAGLLARMRARCDALLQARSASDG